VWKRILAFLLDLYLGLAIAGSLALLVVPDTSIHVTDAITHPERIATPLVIAAFAYLALFILLYHVACEYLVGQTPGMLLFGLVIRQTRPGRTQETTSDVARRVATETGASWMRERSEKDEENERMNIKGIKSEEIRNEENAERSEGNLTFAQALLRNLFLLPFFPFYLLWLIEPLFYVFQGERLLEYWSKTETVEYL
jgi:uncharacterized RDD family membrane protein YckC